jgi:hypothetical protein
VQKAHDGNDRPDWQNPAPLREVRQGRSHENRCGEMGKQWAFRPNERGLKSRFFVVPQFEFLVSRILRDKLCLLRSNWRFFRWLTLDAVAVQSHSRFQKNHPSWSLLVTASTANAEPARRSV